jgi:hypothetical protein
MVSQAILGVRCVLDGVDIFAAAADFYFLKSLEPVKTIPSCRIHDHRTLCRMYCGKLPLIMNKVFEVLANRSPSSYNGSRRSFSVNVIEPDFFDHPYTLMSVLISQRGFCWTTQGRLLKW